MSNYIQSGPFAGAEIAYSGGHSDYIIGTPGVGDYPYDPGPGSTFAPGTYNPGAMAPSIFRGTRKLLSAADIAVVGQFLQFDMNTVDYNPTLSATAVPEPNVTMALGVALVFGWRRRRRRREF